MFLRVNSAVDGMGASVKLVRKYKSAFKKEKLTDELVDECLQDTDLLQQLYPIFETLGDRISFMKEFKKTSPLFKEESSSSTTVGPPVNKKRRLDHQQQQGPSSSSSSYLVLKSTEPEQKVAKKALMYFLSGSSDVYVTGVRNKKMQKLMCYNFITKTMQEVGDLLFNVAEKSTVFYHNDKLFVVGRSPSSKDNPKNQFQVFDLTQKKPSSKLIAGLSISRSEFIPVVCNGFLYAFGGCMDSDKGLVFLESVARYPLTNILQGQGKWEHIKLSKHWFGNSDTLSIVNHGLQVVDDDKIYVVGGCIDNSEEAEMDYVDPEEKLVVVKSIVEYFDTKKHRWVTRRSKPSKRDGVFVAKVGSFLYAMGGTDDDQEPGSRAMDIYNIVENSWTTGTSMKRARTFASTVVIGSEIYVIGGDCHKWNNSDDEEECDDDDEVELDEYDDEQDEEPTMEKYDTIAKEWTLLTDVKLPLDGLYRSVAHCVQF